MNKIIINTGKYNAYRRRRRMKHINECVRRLRGGRRGEGVV